MTSQTATLPLNPAPAVPQAYLGTRLWIGREIALALLAIGAITLSSLVLLRHVDAHWTQAVPAGAWKTLIAASTLLLFRTLIWRPVVAKIPPRSLYPGARHHGMFDEQWHDVPGHREFQVPSADGKQIHGTIVPGNPQGRFADHWVILLVGNSAIYEDFPLQDHVESFGPLTAAGYNIIAYHPPGYGRTQGPRTLQSDLYAADAVMHFLHDVPRHRIHLMGQSIGSGAATELMTRYQLGHSVLLVPLGTVEGVTRGYVGKFPTWLASGVIRDVFEYNNVGKMARLQTRRLTIIQGEADEIMSRERPRQAECLRDAWRRHHGNPQPSPNHTHRVQFHHGRPLRPPMSMVTTV